MYKRVSEHIHLIVITVFIVSACTSSEQDTDNQQQASRDQQQLAGDHFDILIENGRVIDGTSNPWIYADVGIVGDTIVAIGDLEGRTAKKTIDASGLVVTPGFIDMHGHNDDGFDDPDLSPTLNYLLQGVTTIRTGADGSGSYKVAETKQRWEANGMGPNAVTLAGHGVIRRDVMGDDQQRSPTAGELEAMTSLVRHAMQEGAWGLSAQLEYDGYNINVTTEEMIELSKPVAEFDGYYVSHMRNEASEMLAAISETIAIGEGANIRASVTHIKATGRDNWGLMHDSVKLINDARARGVQISADQYPFLQGAPIDYITSLIDVPTDMNVLYELGQSVEENDISTSDQTAARNRYVAALQAALRDPVQRQQLKESTYENRLDNPSAVARWGWQDFRIKVAVINAQLLEKNIAELVDEEGRDGFDIVADLILSEPDMLFAAASQSLDDMRHAMAQDWVMIGSDGVTALEAEGFRAHPRSFATHAIVLRRYVREEKLLTLEDAIRKMSSLPAQLLGMKDRGLLLEGNKADIAVFNPETVRDNATYDNARQYATGVEYVIVNGQVSVENGQFNGTRAGKVLLKKH